MGRPKGSVNKPKEEKEKKCSNCGHERSLHYGTMHNWCNKQDCRCEAWKE